MMTSILIVEDDPADAYLLQHKLTRGGEDKLVSVTVASSGKQAIEFVRQSIYDAAIVDLGLTDADGVEIIQYLVERRPGLIVVAISGSLEGRKGQEVRDRALAVGAHGYIQKPFSGHDNDAVINLVKAHKAQYGRGFEDGSRARAWRTTLGGALSASGALMLAGAMLVSKAITERPLMLIALSGIVLQGVGQFVIGLFAAERK